jgi:maltose alpha-D-glucosyltransferase/alpha-amylase
MWAEEIGRIFLEAYLETTRGASFIPARPEDLSVLLENHQLEKATYEVAYELDNRPDWAVIAARGIKRIVRKQTMAGAASSEKLPA